MHMEQIHSAILIKKVIWKEVHGASLQLKKKQNSSSEKDYFKR